MVHEPIDTPPAEAQAWGPWAMSLVHGPWSGCMVHAATSWPMDLVLMIDAAPYVQARHACPESKNHRDGCTSSRDSR